jgi:hypothetical protein
MSLLLGHDRYNGAFEIHMMPFEFLGSIIIVEAK